MSNRATAEPAKNWAKFLNPASLKANLISASLFLAAYEIFKGSAVTSIRGFIFDDDRYSEHVSSRHKSPLKASLLWLQEQGAINDQDVELADRLRQHRNNLAHNLPKHLSLVDHNVEAETIGSIYALVSKIDRWWIREVRMPTDPAFDHLNPREIADGDLSSGTMIFLKVMAHIATGNDDEAADLFKLFAKVTGWADGVEGREAAAD
ncbi:hypothetical protein [Alienimonas sp. DA493]|uniref:hypothetical protein n=1 Tax=Alienimonas sp. DA493 TaxID=3373605 RepID=UPI003754D897